MSGQISSSAAAERLRELVLMAELGHLQRGEALTLIGQLESQVTLEEHVALSALREACRALAAVTMVGEVDQVLETERLFDFYVDEARALEEE